MAASHNEDLQWQRCGPSDALASMLRACSIDPTEVHSNLDHLLKRYMGRCGSVTTDEETLEWPQKRCYESKMWYYKILEGILQENAQRPVFKNVSNFLENKQLQSSLVVCCLEITSCINKLGFDFDPQLLQIFCLAPYTLWKILALVFYVKVDLTLNVAEHLKTLEEIILESLVWARDSPLWEEIRANEGQMPSCQQLMLPKELEDPMRREQPDHKPLQVDTTSDQQKSTLTSPRKSRLHFFARKVYRLMDKRLTTLCSSLTLQEELRKKIWTCFEHALVHHFDLLRDCQLDWLLLCATHDLTKDIRGLSFKHIINCYKSKHIRKNVPTLIGRPEKSQYDNNHGGRLPTPNTPTVHDQEDEAITSFYCQKYTPVMGPFVKKFTPAPGTETPPLSPYPTPPPASTSRYRWRPEYNIFVSPLNKETTPHQQPTGTVYIIQPNPTQLLNTLVRLCRPHAKREISFDGDDKDEEAGPSAKMPRMGGDTALLRRLQDLEHDRRQSRAQD